ncbi:hypothetical protein [Gracilibacillus salinarum]|uniref:DUF4083 domain-containing protein n=1 Tax=Gracilibacillus salinarum TaxID=2932255 RepID=A0ABY4GMY9_9BACI|nr:hypothetical protein [Gracilibacillus salinarum]UOQ85677.1 hypothetical protein MUN87_01860 [Gracilibacillus salinarum]
MSTTTTSFNILGIFITLIPLILSVAAIIFIIWFALTLIKMLQEKNRILAEISTEVKKFNQKNTDTF